MKILIICSKKFYSKIEEVKNYLEKNNIEVKNIKNLKQQCTNKVKIQFQIWMQF